MKKNETIDIARLRRYYGGMTKKQPRPRPIYVEPPDDLRDLLDERATAERRTVKAVVLAALAAYLATEVRP
jgi:hypothetical protein